jgi:hypothetical protein
MKTNITQHTSRFLCHLTAGALALGLTTTALAQGTTAFTYEGRLNDGPNPATGWYDLKFTLFDAASIGGIVPGTVPVVISAAGVTNGAFTVALDFGPTAFTGAARWLEIAVRTNGAASRHFDILSPRQWLTPTPYAIYTAGAGTAANATVANSVSAGAVTGSGIAVGQVVKSVNSLKDDVTLAAGANVTLTPSGQTLTLATPADWHLGGNSGTVPGASFVGTTDAQPLEFRVANQRALRLENNGSLPNVIGGSGANTAGTRVYGGTISGGDNNTLMSSTMALNGPTIAGGKENTIEPFAYSTTIGGGYGNRIQYDADQAVIAGGRYNLVGTNADNSAIGGGDRNAIADNAHHSTVTGGSYNTNHAAQSSVGGGLLNRIYRDAVSAVIGGGEYNVIGSNATRSVIGGGAQNSVGLYLIGWGEGTPDSDAGVGSTIGGGISNTVRGWSGSGEITSPPANFATIAGGLFNTIYDSKGSSIGGGLQNEARSDWSTVAGGRDNRAWGAGSVVAGGEENRAFGAGSVVAGGGYDGSSVMGNTASGGGSAIGGGTQNVADGSRSTIGGGHNNAATNWCATVPGGAWNIAGGAGSFAAGAAAKVRHDGTFMWNDNSAGDFISTGNNQFLIHANGGVGINKNNPATALDVNGTVTGTGFSQSSDRNLKEKFAPVNPVEVLDKVAALPISRWNFKGDAATPHVGPMAQDFHAAFGLGTDDKHIATVDADGVALAAIQGLNLKLEEQRVENAALEKQVAELTALVKTLAEKVNGGGQ